MTHAEACVRVRQELVGAARARAEGSELEEEGQAQL